MKKIYFFLLASLMLLPVSLKAQNEFVVKLQESFEAGQIPSTWSQEYVVGHQDWAVEQLADYKYPSNQLPDYKADKGGTYRAYLRNSTGQTIGYKTKLVSPAMDLQGVYRPILRFYHAQDKWTADFDTLRVYYRTAPDEDWVLLPDAEYTTAIRSWQWETIELPSYNTSSYQIAFEGGDNMGRGIVLDSIVVRSYPECTQPYDITLSNVANGEATIGWHASWDADQFHVVLTNRKAEMDTLGLIDPAVIAFDTIMEYDGQFTVTAQGLAANTTYYVYLQSICGGQVSDWSEPQTFTMAFKKELPYTETFQMPYTTNSTADMRLESWTWGGSVAPVIDLWITPQNYYIYSRINDPAVVFNGNYSHSSGRFSTPLPADALAYMATPELTGADLKDCQVRMWATMAQRFLRKNANSIIVGIATDPTDITTFTPVDTVTITTKDVIEEFTVSLEKYTGNGRFVVFASYFDKPNQFYIDEVTIEPRPQTAKPDYQTFHIIPDSTSAELSWVAPRADVQSYNILVGTDTLYKNGGYQLSDKVVELNSTTASATITGLRPWDAKGYFVAVQAVYAAGVSEWSEPRWFQTSADMPLPMHFSFEDSEGYYTRQGVSSYFYPNNIMMFSSDVDWPRNTAKTSALAGKDGDKFLYLNMDAGKDAWIVFPEVDDVTKAQINFFLCSQTAANKPRCNIELGVMTSPFDLNTFVKVDEFKAAEKWQRCYGNFVEYTGKGKYIALRWMEPEGASYSTNYIDDVTISELVDCPIVTGVDYTATDTSLVITWNKGRATAWNVKVSSYMFDDADLTVDTKVKGDMYDGSVIGTPTLTVTGLDFAKTYYTYIQADCDGNLTEWTSASPMTTDCKPMFTVPYVETFNGDREGNLGSGFHPVCWYWGGCNYQYLYSSYDSDGLDPEHKGCLYVRTNSASEIGWAAMPELDMPLEDMMLLFDYYSAATLAASYVYVGVMDDPNDFSTFVAVDSVAPRSTSTWHKDIKVNFLNYKGTGKYIAFTCGPLRGSTYVLAYLDYVRVLPFRCQAPDLSFSGITASSMVCHWLGKLSNEAEGWQYIVTNAPLTDEELNADNYTIDEKVLVASGITKNDSVALDELEMQKAYYFYVRALCGDSVWSSASAMTQCKKIPGTGRYVEDFESYGMQPTSSLSGTETYISYFKKAITPDCWTVGTYFNANNIGYSTDPSVSATYTHRNYFPYVASNGTGTTTDVNYYDKGTALTTYHYSNSGTNYLKLYGTYSATATSNHSPAWVAMPEIEATDEEFRAITVKGSFQMSTTSTYRLIIGVMDDPTDLSTFTVLDSVGPGLGTGVGKDVYFEVPLENYTGTGRYVAFRTPFGITTTAYLDDIVIDGTGCYQPQPSLSRLTSQSVRLTAGLRGQTDWMYVVTDAEVSDELFTAGVDAIKEAGINIVDIDTLPNSSRFKVITGLEEDSTYHISVMAICDPASGLYSQGAHLSFTTLCAPVKELNEDFEGFDTGSGKKVGCWISGSLTESATNLYIPYVNNTASYRSYGDKYLYLYSTTTYNGAYAIAPAFDCDDITKYQVAFYARSATSSAYAKKLKVGVLTDPLDLSTMTIIDTLDIAITPGRYLVSFAGYKGDLEGNMGKHLVFLSDFNATNQIGVGQVEIQPIPACQIPSKLEVESLTDVEAVIGWQGNADKYEVLLTSQAIADTVLNKGLDQDEVKAVLLRTVVVDTTGVKFAGLIPATNYFVHIRAICGTDTTDFDYSGKQFMTECAERMPLPYFTDFDDMPNGTSQRPTCWMGNYTLASSNSYPYVYNNTSYSHSGAQSVYLYGSSSNQTVLVSPKIAIDKLSNLQVTLWVRGSSANKILNIGVVPEDSVALGETDALNRGFISLMTYTNPVTTGEYVTINFDEIVPDSLAGYTRFAIATDLSSAAGTFYLDDLSIRKIPSCFVPTALEATGNTANTISLHFEPGKPTDTKWEVALWKDELGADTTYVVVDTFDCVINGLSSSTIYNIAVRTLCEDNEQSELSLSIKASTEYEVDTFTWTFDGDEFSALVEGSTSYYLHPALTPGSNSATDSYLYKAQRTLNTGNANNGTYVYASAPTYVNGEDAKTAGAMRLYTSSTVDTAYVILPKIINADKKQLSFDVRAGYAYAPDYPAASTYDYHSQMYYSYTPTLLVGTFDEGAGLESFKELYKVRMPALKNISDDPIYPDPQNTTDKHGEYALPENNYLFNRITVPVESSLEGKRLVILSTFVRKKSSQSSCYAYIDNLSVENKTAEVATPQIISNNVVDTAVTIYWEANGGKAWDVLVYDSTVYFADVNAQTHLIKKLENVTATSAEITDLTEKTDYCIYLALAGNSSLGAVSTRLDVRTACAPLPVSTVFDFDDDDVFIFRYSSTDYQYPNECWSYGLNTQVLNGTYYTNFPRIRYNTESTSPTATTYQYSRSGKAALQFYTSSEVAKQRAYVVLPYMNFENLDDMEMVFYMRDGYHYLTGSSKDKMSMTNALSYDRELVVGMVEDPEDFFGTFTPIDTLVYKYGPDVLTSSNKITDDPTGEKWWEKKVVSLKSGHGKYIALYKPGYHLGSYIDDISFQVRQTALMPTNLKGRTTAYQIFASWLPKQEGTGFRFQLSTDDSFSALLVDSTVVNNNIEIGGLTPNTQYFVRVKQVGTKYGDTDFTAKVILWTECVPTEGAVATSFEGAAGNDVPTENYRNYTSTLLKNQCWTYDNAGTSTTVGTSYPYNIGSTTSVSYALTGDFALKLYAYSTTYAGYVVTPRMENLDLDTMQLTFWMTPCPHGTSGTYKDMVSTAWAAANAAQVEVGTCSDPADLETFVPIDTIKYSRYTVDELVAKAPSTAANDFTYQKFTLPLTGAVGPYVYMRAVFDKLPNVGKTTATSSSTVYVDNFSVERQLVCATPSDLKAVNVIDTTATLRWSAGEDAKSYRLQVSADYRFDEETMLVDSVLEQTSFDLNGLKAATRYYARLKMTCVENGEGDWSSNIDFRTAEAPLYYEQFRMATQLADGWSFAAAKASEIFSEKATFTYNTSVPGSTAGWYQANENEALSGAHFAGRPYSTTAKWWMMSPAIILNQTDTAMLSFMMNYVLYNANWSTDKTWRAITHQVANGDGITGVDDQFMVIISDDGGETWKRENAIIWNNEQSDDPKADGYLYGKGDYVLNNIRFLGNNPTDQDRIRIDLSKYQGKIIRIAFYVESTINNANNVIHIDDIHVNYVNTVVEQNTICQFEDYESELKDAEGEPLFTVNGDAVAVGSTLMDNYTMSVERGVNDTVRQLSLNVLEAPQINLGEATICEGTLFSDYGFNELAVAGVYKRKGIVEETGCAKIETFTLNVIPRQQGQMEETICQGSKFTWQTSKGAVELDRAGVYFDTIPSLVTGCDSVITFVLNVSAPDTIDVEAEVAENELPYEYNGMLLGEGLTVGEYEIEAPITDENGCVVIIRLSLTVTEPTIEALDNLVAGELSITPSVISRGETVTVSGELSSRQMRDMRLDVFDATGKCVYSTEPKTLPAKADGFVSAGIYSVRLTTGSGESYVGRVLVK